MMHGRLSVHESCMILFLLQVDRRVALNIVHENDNNLDDPSVKQVPQSSPVSPYSLILSCLRIVCNCIVALSGNTRP